MPISERSKQPEREATILPLLVHEHVETVGDAQAAEFFGVTESTVARWKATGPPVWAIEKVYLHKLGQREGALPHSGQPVIAANWEGKNLLLCLPWYKQVSPFTALSLLAMFEKEKMGVLMASGDAFISHTRNRLAKAFLETNAEWSLWVDDDMILPMGKPEWFLQVTSAPMRAEWAGQHTINRLLSHGKPLVGALYTGRQRAGRLMFCEGMHDLTMAESIRRKGPSNECRPTRWVATGCLLVHRAVFEGLDKKYPHLKQNFFSPSEHDLFEALEKLSSVLMEATVPAERKILDAIALLEKGRTLSNTNSRVGTGEDVIFCVRAGQAGFQPHIDMGLVCGHIGTEIFGPWNTRTEAPAV